MNCQECRELLDNLLIEDPSETEQAELIRHTEACPACAQERDSATAVLSALAIAHPIRARADFKERVMCAMANAGVFQPRSTARGSSWFRHWKAVAAVAVAAGLAAVLLPLFRHGAERGGATSISAFSLFSEACAAEDRLLSRNELVHLVSEILVAPVADPTLARMRWFPLISLDASGNSRFHQLTLGAEPGKGCAVEDQAWYDTSTGRFVRVLSSEGKPVFANSFDGSNVYHLEQAAGGVPRVVKDAVTKDFRRPQSPAEFLGIAAGLRSGLNEKDESLVQDAGTVVLDDGAAARVVKVGFPRGGPKRADDAYSLFTIRVDNHTIEKMEMFVQGQSMFVVRRVKADAGQTPKIGWDLGGVVLPASGAAQKSGLGVVADMVIPNVSVEHMVKKAAFPTYVFAQEPSWAGNRQITDILDVPSPPHRMFAISYRAKDGRHVVLVQSYSYNKMLGPMIKRGKVVYTSPGGIKVWSGPMDKWLAQILLQSAQAATQAPPAKNAIGYLLETPDGTFPALAINGEVSEAELHALVDSLVPAAGKTSERQPAKPTAEKPASPGQQH